MLQHRPPPLVEVVQGEVYGDALDQEEYDKFKSGLRCWRDVLLAKLLRVTGLRVMELLRLEVYHYDVQGPEFSLLVHRSKKRKKDLGYEKVYLPPSLGVEVRDYIRGNHRETSDKVFSISDRTLRYAFEKAGRKTLGRSVHPHELRHLYVKTLIDGGVPVLVASKLVGHSDPRVTQQWYYDLTTAQRRAIGERMPT